MHFKKRLRPLLALKSIFVKKRTSKFSEDKTMSSALEHSILNDQFMKMFLDHLEQIKNKFTTQALNYFLNEKDTSKIHGNRLFYKIDGAGKNDTIETDFASQSLIVNISSVLEKEILECIGKNKDFSNYFDQMKKMFEKQEVFNNIIQEFEKTHPGKGEELTRMISAQAAYTLYEKVLQKRYENHKEVKKYLQIESQISGKGGINEQLKELRKNSKDNAKEIEQLGNKKSKLQKEQEKYTSAYEKEGKKLQLDQNSARQQAVSYRNPEATKRKTPQKK